MGDRQGLPLPRRGYNLHIILVEVIIAAVDALCGKRRGDRPLRPGDGDRGSIHQVAARLTST